jgi:hypothetical protein
MALPETVRVKLSSEAAGAISLTPVVAQQIPLRDLIEHMLAIAGKDEARLRDILFRGTLVSGGSRFRWTGWDADAESLREFLATFPDPDPSRPFAAQQCIRAVLRGSRQAVEIPREAGATGGLFRRTTFWDVLMEAVRAAGPAYSGYSYRDRADRYVCHLQAAMPDRLRAAASAIRYSVLRDRIQSATFAEVELYAGRLIR